MDYKALGKRLQEERLKLGITQAQLAEDIDVSEAYVGHIERGERQLSLSVLVNMVNRLGITLDYVLSDSVHPSDDMTVKQFIQLIEGKTEEEKVLLINIIKSILSFNKNNK